MNIRFKLLMSVIFVVLVFNSILFFISFKYLEKSYIQEKDNKRNELKIVLTHTISPLLYNFDKPKVDLVLQTYLNQEDIIKIALFDKDGIISTVLSDKDFDNYKNLIKKEIPLSYNNYQLGKLTVYFTNDFLKLQLKKIIILIYFVIFIAMLLLVTLIVIITNTFIHPLENLCDVSLEIANGKLDTHIDIKSNDEVGKLAKNFQIMQDSVIKKINSLNQLNENLNIEIQTNNSYKIYIDAIFNNVSDAIFIHDLKGNIIDVNLSMIKLYEMKNRTEAVKYSITDYSSSNLDDGKVAQLFESIKLKKSLSFEWESLKPKTKEFFYSHVTLQLVNLPDRSIVIATVRNITDQKIAESKLLQSEKKYRLLIDNAPIGVVMATTNFDIVSCNKAFCNELGYTESELLKMNAKDITRMSDIQKNDLTRFINSRKNSLKFEKILIRKNGTTYIVNQNLSVLRDQEGHPEYIIATSENITKQKEIYEKLEESEEKFRSIFDSAHDAIYLMKLDDNNNAIIVSANKVAEDNTGYSHDELINTNIKTLSNSIKPSEIDRIIDKLIKGEDLHYESQQIRKDKTVYPIYVSLKFISIGKKRYILSVERDISEQKKIREQIIQSEKLSSMGSLAAGMAHEINNPLAGIVQNIQVLSNRILKPNKKNEIVAKEIGLQYADITKYNEKRDIPKIMDSISSSCFKAAEIIKRMLNFSRKSSFVYDAIFLNDIIDETLIIASQDYKINANYDFKKINIEKNYEKLDEIYLNKNEIHQVLLNILLNAAQALFTKRDIQPKITITTISELETQVIKMD